MTVGERIKWVRENKGMSQEELAKKMGYKDRSSVTKIEKGSDDNIYMDTIQKVADILECSPLYLMGWEKYQDNLNKQIERFEKYDQFISLYEQLPKNYQALVDNMLITLTEKQEVHPASQETIS